MDIHLRQIVSHYKKIFFFQKSRLCLGGRVRLKSRRELKDKIFAKIRKTNVKIIAKNEKEDSS
jgi:hypothetical protein